MKKYLFLSLLVLSACGGNVKENLGLTREGPDEFAVERKPKLEVPPSFKLRPPTPGEDPLNVSTPRDDARKALIGEQPAETKPETTAEPASDAATTETKPLEIVPPATTEPADTGSNNAATSNIMDLAPERTEGENLFLKNAISDSKDDNIRSILKQEYKQEQDQGVLGSLENLSNDNFDKTVVDPAAEKERIQTNKKENKPITEGETPAKSINHDKSVIEKIFN